MAGAPFPYLTSGKRPPCPNQSFEWDACQRALPAARRPSTRALGLEVTLRYKVEGYAETRDAIIWIGMCAPHFKFGLTLQEVFAALEHGYESLRPKLKDAERISQFEHSQQKMRQALRLFEVGDIHNGKLTLQEAEELFTTLRRIRGKKVSRQVLGESEHGANEVDEGE
jgi:hypothetical protein